MSVCLFMGCAYAVIYTALVIYAVARHAISQFHLKIVNRIWGIDKKLPVTHQDEEVKGKQHCFYYAIFSFILFWCGYFKNKWYAFKIKRILSKVNQRLSNMFKPQSACLAFYKSAGDFSVLLSEKKKPEKQ